MIKETCTESSLRVNIAGFLKQQNKCTNVWTHSVITFPIPVTMKNEMVVLLAVCLSSYGCTRPREFREHSETKSSSLLCIKHLLRAQTMLG